MCKIGETVMKLFGETFPRLLKISKDCLLGNEGDHPHWHSCPVISLMVAYKNSQCSQFHVGYFFPRLELLTFFMDFLVILEKFWK